MYTVLWLPQMTAGIQRQGDEMNRKRIARLIQEMGIQALFPRRNLSELRLGIELPKFVAFSGDYAAKSGTEYRHHLRADYAGVYVSRGNHRLVQLRCTGLAVIQTMDGAFYLDTLNQALVHGKSEICNTE